MRHTVAKFDFFNSLLKDFRVKTLSLIMQIRL